VAENQAAFKGDQKMRKIFFDDVLNSSFLANGYVVVNFLDTEQVNALEKLYKDEKFPSLGNFYLTIWADEPAHRLMIHNSVQQIIDPICNKLLNNYKPVISSFAVKKSDPKSSWHPHQDDTFVDEKKFVSLSVWISLCDTNAHNGALQVSVSSHKKYTGPRSPNIPASFKHETNQVPLQNLETKAGQAIVFDHRLVHASAENNSGKERVAVVTVLIPSEAGLTYLYLDTSTVPATIRQYEISERYYLEAPLGQFSKEPKSSQFHLLATYPYIESNSTA
jgi:hypothetical protein